jgi:hypothetical protein
MTFKKPKQTMQRIDCCAIFAEGKEEWEHGCRRPACQEGHFQFCSPPGGRLMASIGRFLFSTPLICLSVD